MTRLSKVQYFDAEGRANLPQVIKCIKSFLRDREGLSLPVPTKLVFLTREGEGPLLAYNQFHSSNMKIIAVTFPAHFAGTQDGKAYVPEVPERLRKFFNGVEIPIITSRLPFDEIVGSEAHNHDMALLRNSLSVFGGSIPLAIQAVLQATDSGYVNVGELVIAATGDTALLVIASSTRFFLSKDERGLVVSEILCKPRTFSVTRKLSSPQLPTLASAPSSVMQIEGKTMKPTES
jgi:hypothetical protein